ncbi:MAG: DUF11 domain-containing protein [Acidobacteriota bacterium]
MIIACRDPTTYTIVASNAGPSTVTDASLADVFPAELINCTYTSVAAGGAAGNTAAGSGDIADTLTLPPAGLVTYTATCDVDLSASGTVANTATISSTLADDPAPANDSATDTDDVIGSTDLRLEKVASPTVIDGGDPVTYTLTVTNDGPNAAVDVVVTDMLPPEVTLVSTSGCAEDPVGAPTCSLGPLAASASVQFTIDVTVNPSPPVQIVNTATVASDNPDPNPANDTATATLSTDAVPPQVVSVSSQNQTIEDCETLNSERVTELRIVFDEAMSTATRGGDGLPPNADVLDNYFLVRPGQDRSFQTVACDALAGDDRRVLLGGITYAGDTPAAPEATVTLDRPVPLAFFTDDLYRLIVCGNITDEGGNPLDGDGDGAADGSDDFVLDFRLDHRNLFANAHLDCDLDGWDIDPPGSVQVTQSAEDFEGSTSSGSAQAAFATEEAFGLSQCVETVPSDGPYRLGANVRVDAGAGIQLVASRSCVFFDQAGCVGGEVGTEEDLLFLGDTTEVFVDKPDPFLFPLPAGAVSASCQVRLQALDDAIFDGFVDNFYVGPGDDPIFGDGFESGDVSRWDAAVGN